MSDIHPSGTRALDGRFVKGHPGGPGRPRKEMSAANTAPDERGVPSRHSFDVAIELAAGRTVTTVKVRLAGK
jgi:hypothetical protein